MRVGSACRLRGRERADESRRRSEGARKRVTERARGRGRGEREQTSERVGGGREGESERGRERGRKSFRNQDVSGLGLHTISLM